MSRPHSLVVSEIYSCCSSDNFVIKAINITAALINT